MRNLLFLVLIATVITSAGCKKEIEESERVEEAEPAVPGTLEEAQLLIIGKWKLIGAISKISAGADTIETRTFTDSIYLEYSEERRMFEYLIEDGKQKTMVSLVSSIDESRMPGYKYEMSLFYRPATLSRQIIKLTKSTLITWHSEYRLYAMPYKGHNIDRETFVLEYQRVVE